MEAKSVKRIGFIGVGLMGHGAAKNILEGGYPLTVLAHRNRVPVDDLVGRGASEAKSPVELASMVDVLFTCVSDSRVMETVVTGENGVLEGARKGLVLVDMTTAEPSSTLDLASALAAKGATMVDGPVTLTPKEAEEGRLNIMIGAEPALLEELRPILETFCERIFHTGPLGTAHTLKLINNFLTLGNSALTVEACTAARKAGVDPKMMVDLISVSGGNSASFQRMARLLIGEGDPAAAAFAVRNALKDVSYFWRLAENQGVHAPLADSIRRWYDLAVALDQGDELMPELFELHAKLSRVADHD
jgi:3-hydroxyisobutyrate dehydrogenase-like beta-hydroxyacid dehydrogenase